MKAFLIDVVAREVREVDVKTRFDVYDLIGNECSLYEVPLELETGDAVLTDEESLYHPIIGGWKMDEFTFPLVGNAVVVGSSEDTDYADVQISKEMLSKMIIWCDVRECEEHRDIALSTPPKMYFW